MPRHQPQAKYLMVKTPHRTKLASLPANTFQLDNGLTIVHQEINATPVVATDVWIRAGANISNSTPTGFV